MDSHTASNITQRCSPGALYLLIPLLSENAKKRFRELGFKHMLGKLGPTRMPNLQIVEWLMDRADVKDGEIVLNVKEKVVLTLIPEDVHLILGVDMPCGRLMNLPEGNAQSSCVYNEMFKLLKCASKWIPNKA